MTLLVKLALLGLVTLAALVIAELVSRWAFGRRGRRFVWVPFQRSRLEIDPESLPDLPPVVEQRFNADGERGDAPPTDSSVYRVLVAGGSAAECYMLDQPDTWSEQLKSALEASGGAWNPDGSAPSQRVHVGNVSRSLVSCEYITKILAELLPHYAKLDAIVFMVGASDVVYWLEQSTPLTIEEDRLPPAKIFAELPEGPFGWSPKSCALRRVAERWLSRLGRTDQRQRVGKRLIELRKMRAAARIEHEVPEPAALIDYFSRHFRALLELAQACGARVIVARQPWLEREFTPEEEQRLWNFGRGRPYEGSIEVYYAHRVVSALMQAVDDAAVAIAQELGVEHVDLRPELDMSFEHFYDRLHFTPAGARVVGQTLARKLAAPPGPSARPG